MKPEDVNPSNFKVEKILYNKNGFSIAIGIWRENGHRRFAMRWNEQGSRPATDKGYPSVFQHPMWFQLPNDVNDIIQVLTDNNVEIPADDK